MDGVVVTAVKPDGPADKAGIKSGDVIKRIKETAVANVDDFEKAVSRLRPGDKPPVLVQSRNLSRFVVVTIPKE